MDVIYYLCYLPHLWKEKVKKKKTTHAHTYWSFRSIPINWTEKSLLIWDKDSTSDIAFLLFVFPPPNNKQWLIFCASLFVVSTLWCTSIYSLDTSYTLWRSSRKVTIFLVKSKATCLRAWSIWLYMKCCHAVFPWALWATDCSWGELLLGKQKYRQLFAFLGMFTMSLVLLEISLWKLRETEEFCTRVQLHANIYLEI